MCFSGILPLYAWVSQHMEKHTSSTMAFVTQWWMHSTMASIWSCNSTLFGCIVESDKNASTLRQLLIKRRTTRKEDGTHQRKS